MEPHFLGYHLSAAELSETFTRAGGDLRGNDPEGTTAMQITRTVLFHYLLPGKVQIWFNYHLDNTDHVRTGITFVIGKYNDELDDLKKGLRKRCRIMFKREPDRFVEVGPTEDNPHGRVYKWWRGEELLGKVSMSDWLGSEEEPECINLGLLLS